MKYKLLILGLCIVLLSSFANAATVHYWQGNVQSKTSWACSGGGSNVAPIYFDAVTWCRAYWEISGLPQNMSNVDSAVLLFQYSSGGGGQSASAVFYNISPSQMEIHPWTFVAMTCGTTEASLTGSCANNPSIGTVSLTGSASSVTPDKLNMTTYMNNKKVNGIIYADTNMTNTFLSGNIANNYGGAQQGIIQIYYTTGLSPDTPTPTLVSVDGTNSTTSNLNCSATITDPNADKMNVSVQYFNNTKLMASYSLNNNYVNGTTVSHIFSSNNFTASNVGNNITCSMQLNDGDLPSNWGNSSSLTLLRTFGLWEWTNISISQAYTSTSGIRGQSFKITVAATCSNDYNCTTSSGSIHLDPQPIIYSKPKQYGDYWYIEII